MYQKIIQIIRSIARIAGAAFLTMYGLIFFSDAFHAGVIIGIGMLLPLVIISILFFTWDRWKITRIIGIIGFLVLYAIILYEVYVNVNLGTFYVSLSVYPMFSGTLLAYKWEGFGGACAILGWIIFAVTGVARFTVTLPFMILGITYMFCWFGSKQLLKKSEKREEPTTI
jgi:hypothetical protein